MFRSDEDLPLHLRRALPQYSDINYYFVQVCREFLAKAQEDYYGSSDFETIAKWQLDPQNEVTILFMIPYSTEQLHAAIMARSGYSKIVKRGFKRAETPKSIAGHIFSEMKKDEGGCEAVNAYIDKYE